MFGGVAVEGSRLNWDWRIGIWPEWGRNSGRYMDLLRMPTPLFCDRCRWRWPKMMQRYLKFKVRYRWSVIFKSQSLLLSAWSASLWWSSMSCPTCGSKGIWTKTGMPLKQIHQGTGHQDKRTGSASYLRWTVFRMTSLKNYIRKVILKNFMSPGSWWVHSPHWRVRHFPGCW